MHKWWRFNWRFVLMYKNDWKITKFHLFFLIFQHFSELFNERSLWFTQKIQHYFSRYHWKLFYSAFRHHSKLVFSKREWKSVVITVIIVDLFRFRSKVRFKVLLRTSNQNFGSFFCRWTNDKKFVEGNQNLNEYLVPCDVIERATGLLITKNLKRGLINSVNKPIKGRNWNLL